MLNYNYCYILELCHLQFYKEAEKGEALFRWQITIIYPYFWKEKLVLVVEYYTWWLCREVQRAGLNLGIKMGLQSVNCQINNNVILTFK